MYLTRKEFEAIHDAIDFITTNSDGADDDQYPHDTLTALRSIVEKYKSARHKSLVRNALLKLNRGSEKIKS